MKKKHIILLLLILLIITSIFVSKTITKTYYVNKEEQNVEEVNDYFTTKINDINKLINDEITGYVYFGRDTCRVCLYLNTFLEKEYNENSDLLIYKFDTDYWRDNENFQNVLDKYSVSTVPTLIKINKDKTYEAKKFDGENEEEMQLELHEFLYN